MTRMVFAAMVALVAALPAAHGGLYAGMDDGSAPYDTASGEKCTVWADHSYDWSPLDPPRNNAPHEKSLYPGDMVRGGYTWGSSGCCRTETSFGSAGMWSRTEGPAGSYVQHMRIVPNEPVPGAKTYGPYLQTASYDGEGRSRTHHQGVNEGHGLTAGSTFAVRGYIKPDPLSPCNKLDATVTVHSDFRYRNPFWETSIFEHHILTQDGWPASNLDHTQYRHDAIPLETGSNLVLGGYRWETIRITHALEGAAVASEFHCTDKTCHIDLPVADSTPYYIGNAPYAGVARNPPWEEPDGGTIHMLDDGEAMFSAVADKTGQISIVSTMWNLDREVARGYNATHQFIQSYEPVMHATAMTNTAVTADSALERPVSVIIQYNGTVSDTTHYCSVGVVHDRDRTPIPVGEYGAADAWGRLVGETCPEERPAGQWGTVGGGCDGGACSYTVHPERPASFGWGRWSAVNPETRAALDGFEGAHTVCEGGGCTAHHTPYLNWDYAPATDREFIPACTVAQLAAGGGQHTNVPKPEKWGLSGDWGFGETFSIGEGAAPHSYRGIFAAHNMPRHHVVDRAQCEHMLGERECVPRGGGCRPEYDRRCEDVFAPYLYPDDYIMHGHQRLQDMVAGWCGRTPAEECALEAYRTIDEVMVELCTEYQNTDYGRVQTVDMSVLSGSGFTPAACHAAYSVGLYAPAVGGEIIRDWRACYGAVPGSSEPSDPPAVWPGGRPDSGPHLCASVFGGATVYTPIWEGEGRLVYVPYTPTTGAFGGVVERPGNMLADDGTLTCSCTDADGNSICDMAEEGTDLDGNGIVDDWDQLLVDGAVTCLDRTGSGAAGVAACWAKYGRDRAAGGGASTSERLDACLDGIDMDGPDGDCDPAVVVGVITPDGRVDMSGLADPGIIRDVPPVPFLGTGGVIPIPYVVDGDHMYCDESEAWCLSSGDTYQTHTPHMVCENPDAPLSVKRIPAPATIPPLYRPAFDGAWPPDCLPPYPIADWERPDHPVSLDFAGAEAQWPTAPPDSAVRTPSFVGMDDRMMFMHAGTGVVRFGPCSDCDPGPSADGGWSGTMHTKLGGASHMVEASMSHPPFVTSQQGVARVVAVEPCGSCEGGWRPGTGMPGIALTLTAYPEMQRPVAEAGEMAAHRCQIDGDGGTAMLNPDAEPYRDLWHGMSCRDGPGISITIQDYEAAMHGPAAKREAGQPWTVASGVNDVSVGIFRNGIWLHTMSILEHRGQCARYDWSPDATPGHTSCPATAHACADGGVLGCATDTPRMCGGVFVEDGMHKKWAFTEAEASGMLEVGGAGGCGTIQCAASCLDGLDACTMQCGTDSGCLAACGREMGDCSAACTAGGTCIGGHPVRYSGCGGACHPGGVPVVHRMPDGSYAENGVPVGAAALAWQGSGPAVLGCEAAVGSDGIIPAVLRDIPARAMDFNVGGSFACKEVVGCERQTVAYKCLGGELTRHVTCDVPAETYSVLDMPYEEVMGSVGPQMLHTEAVCPAGHPLAGRSPGCHGGPIYDTHVLSGASSGTTIYVDYHGVGELAAGREGTTIHLRPPATFGEIHRITVDGRDMQAAPCTICSVEHAAAGTITATNVYGATLTTEVGAAEPHPAAAIHTDEIAGTAWLYLPALAALAAAWIVLKKYGRDG